MALAAVYLVLALGAGCAGFGPGAGGDRRASARDLAADQGFHPASCRAGEFDLACFAKDGPGRVLTVYIEGDGRAYLSRNRPSPDPTPVDPVGLKLALADPSDKVLYLARPCQYAPDGQLKECDMAYWTLARFSEPVVKAVNRALDEAKARMGADAIRLAGFSGGGVLAALAASERDDVLSLVTVAAPLDHELWTSLHRVAPLSRSLSPMDRTARLAGLPQLHFAGGDDDVVPPDVARSYMAALGYPDTAELVVIPGFDHTCCWDRSWRTLLARYQPRIRELESRRF